VPLKNSEERKKYILTWKKDKRKRDPLYGRKYQPSYEQKRNSYIKRKYGITNEEYNFLLKAQNGVCAICKCPEMDKDAKGRIKNLAIDHDHITNQIRGLLCTACNVSLGRFKDSILILESALQYLQKYKGTQ
jgi:hypothetical protein